MFNKMSFNQIKSSIEKRRIYLPLAPKPSVRLPSFKQINIDVVVNVKCNSMELYILVPYQTK